MKPEQPPAESQLPGYEDPPVWRLPDPCGGGKMQAEWAFVDDVVLRGGSCFEPQHRNCLELASTLFQAAQKGNFAAVNLLHGLAVTFTMILNELAKGKTELVRETAQYQLFWPVIKGKVTQAFGENETDLFRLIQLGEAHSHLIETDPQTAKYKMDYAGRVAYSLLEHVRYWKIYETKAGEPPDEYEWFDSLTRPLTEFNDETSGQWWDVAQVVLKTTHPDLAAVPQLRSLIKAKSRTKSPGRLRAAILELLKKRFLSLAPNRSYHT